MQKFNAIVGAFALAVSTTAFAADNNPLIGDEIGIDHILLWSQDEKSAEHAFDRLGFSLSPKAVPTGQASQIS